MKKLILIILVIGMAVMGCKSPMSPDIDLALPTIEYFTANPSTIKLNEYSTLSWSTTNATTISISGIGTVSATGMRDVNPSESTSYTLTAKNNDGQKTSSCTVMISRWAVVELSLSPVSPVVYFWADGTSTSNFTVIVDETNGVGGQIDTIRVIGTPPSGSAWSQAFEGGTFSANGSFSRYCSMFLYCWPEHVLIKAEGVDMHGYVIDVGISFFVIWSQNTGIMKFSEIVYGANHHKLIK